MIFRVVNLYGQTVKPRSRALLYHLCQFGVVEFSSNLCGERKQETGKGVSMLHPDMKHSATRSVLPARVFDLFFSA